jgi:hypothetical protein
MVFSPRLEAIPLQAADLHAFLATKYAEARLKSGNPKVEPSYFFRRVMERPNNVRFLDEGGLAFLLDGCPQVFRTSLMPPVPRTGYGALRGGIGE